MSKESLFLPLSVFAAAGPQKLEDVREVPKRMGVGMTIIEVRAHGRSVGQTGDGKVFECHAAKCAPRSRNDHCGEEAL